MLGSVTEKPEGQWRPGSWVCRCLSSGFAGEKKCALPRRGGLLWGGSGLGLFLSVLSRFRLGRGVTLY